LGLDAGPLPFAGVDLWRAWELSWLDPQGKPAIAVAEIEVPATSANIVESKSLKLYLGSLNNHRLPSVDALTAMISADLGAVVQAPVSVRIILASSFHELSPAGLEGTSLDGVELLHAPVGTVDAAILEGSSSGGMAVRRAVVSQLFRSRCPITGQPDWASVRIAYRGPAIAEAPLLRYLLSYRDHGGFHEACVERIFVDLMGRCGPSELTVQACFTRRGGLDINPWRSTAQVSPRVPRPWRS